MWGTLGRGKDAVRTELRMSRMTHLSGNPFRAGLTGRYRCGGRLNCAAPGAGSVYGHWQGRERGPGQCLRRDASVQRHPQPSALSALAERKVDSDRLLALSSTQSAFQTVDKLGGAELPAVLRR